MLEVNDVKSWSLRVGDQERGARSGETFEVLNPATGRVIATVPRCREEDVDDVVTAAQKAQKHWSELAPLARASLLSRLADVLDEHDEELALLDALDNGSPISYFRTDVKISTWQLRYFAGLALEVKGHTIPGDRDRLNYTLQQPYGVVGRITPFNHPFLFACRGSAAPLIAGNAIVIKPSEHTPLSSLRYAELAADVLGPGVVNVISGFGEEAGAPLVRHPVVRRVGFTGSVEGGQRVLATSAAAGIKHVSCELGGKNPLVVMPDADIDAAVAGAVNGMNFTWSSQSCGSTSRLLVSDTIHDQVVDALASSVAALSSGPPEDSETTMGSLVNQMQYDKVQRYMEIGRSDGADEVVRGGPASVPGHPDGLFVRPAVFDNVDPSSRLAQEEIFGPVLSIMRFGEFDDAVRIANGVSFGLTAGIYTRDLGLAHRFARDVEAGTVWVNDSSRHFPGAPFGGWKDSGVGREESIDEIFSYSQIKNVNVRFE